MIYIIKQNDVNFRLASIHNCKMAYSRVSGIFFSIKITDVENCSNSQTTSLACTRNLAVLTNKPLRWLLDNTLRPKFFINHFTGLSKYSVVKDC